MQVREIHIDRFGAFTDKSILGFRPGVNVVYGANEAGKTTLLEWIRRILFGFSRVRNSAYNAYAPKDGAPAGGRLVCELGDGKPLTVARTEGPKGGPVHIFSNAGEREGDLVLESFLGHATREIFNNIFAFTLDELQDFGSLSGEEIKNRIYGAGLGVASLKEVEKFFQDSCGELFKPRGKSQELNLLFHEIQLLEKEIHSLRQGLDRYEALCLEKQRAASEKLSLKSRIEALREKEKDLKIQLNLFPEYMALKDAENQLRNFESDADVPEDTFQTYKQVKVNMEQLTQRIQEDREALDQLTVERDVVAVNEPLLAESDIILSLQRHTEMLRTALQDMVLVQNERDLLNDSLQKDIAQIGEGWDEELVAGFQLSPDEEDQIETFQKSAAEAAQKVNSVQDKLSLHWEHMAMEQSKKPRLPKGIAPLSFLAVTIGAAGIGWGGYIENYPLMIVAGLILVTGLVLSWISMRETAGAPAKDPHETALLEQLDQAEEAVKEINDQWRGWLTKNRFDPSLSGRALEKTLDLIKNIQNQIKQKSELEQRLSAMKNTDQTAWERIEKISRLLPEPPSSNDPIAAIELIGHHFEESKKKREQRAVLNDKVVELTEKLKKRQELLGEMRDSLEPLFKSVRAAGGEDLENLYQRNQDRRACENILKEKKRILQTQLGEGEAYQHFLDSAQFTQPAEIEKQLENVREQLDHLGQENDRLNESIGKVGHEIERLSNSDELLVRQTEMETKKRKLNEMAEEWAVGTLALSMLQRAKRKYERERQPGVIKAAEAVFSQVTGKKYRRIYKRLDSEEIRIAETDSSASLGPAEMSRGTREQLYLAMRFGLIEEYETRSEPLPVVMDDVLVNFDDARKKKVIKLLSKFAESRQLITLTCHQSTLDAYRKLGAHTIEI